MLYGRMVEYFRLLFDTSGFPARWNCGQWSDAHGWLHILSDLAIFGAYSAIPLTLVYFYGIAGMCRLCPSLGYLRCSSFFAA